MPKTVNVLGHSSSEGCTAITPEPLHVVCRGSSFEQAALFLQRLLVDLALDPHADFVAQKHPVSTEFPVRQSFPERLAEAQQQLHRDIMRFTPRCRTETFSPSLTMVHREATPDATSGGSEIRQDPNRRAREEGTARTAGRMNSRTDRKSVV